jgi:hypothetical protein
MAETWKIWRPRCASACNDFNDDVHDMLISLTVPPHVLAKILSGIVLRLVPA